MGIQCDKAKLRMEPLSAMPYLARLITAPRRFTQGTSPHVSASEQIIIQDHTDFRGKLRSVYERAGGRETDNSSTDHLILILIIYILFTDHLIYLTDQIFCCHFKYIELD